MTKRNLRVLSYARVSDVRGREGPGCISEPEQFSKHRYCETYDHTVIEEVSTSVSPAVSCPPTFDDFLSRVQASEAGRFIVARPKPARPLERRCLRRSRSLIVVGTAD